MQNFVGQAVGVQYPKAIVEGPTYATTFSVDGHFWKAYYRKCNTGGATKQAYQWLGRPTSEDAAYVPYFAKDIQYFQGGSIEKDFADINHVQMKLNVAGQGSCTWIDALDTNNDPCYDVDGTWDVEAGDQLLVQLRFGQNEANPAYDDRYDVNADTIINSGDLLLVGQQQALYGFSCH